MDLADDVVVEDGGDPEPAASQPSGPALSLSDLSTDDFIAVRNGEAKIEDLKAAPKAAEGQESSVERSDGEGKEPAVKPKVEAKAEKPAEKPKGRLRSRQESIQAEINALTRERGETQRERDAIKAELADLRSQRDAASAEIAGKKPAAAAADKPAASDKPTWAAFEDAGKTYDEFLEARDEWTQQKAQSAGEAAAQKKFEELQTADRARIERESADRAAAALADTYSQSLDAARSQHADFDAVIDQEIPVTAPMRAAIVNSDDPGNLLYYLGSNPKECERIAKLAPGAAIKAIGRIEERLEAAGTAHSGPAPHASVKRPHAPIKPVGGSGSTSTVPDSELSTDDFIDRQDARERKTYGRA